MKPKKPRCLAQCPGTKGYRYRCHRKKGHWGEHQFTLEGTTTFWGDKKP